MNNPNQLFKHYLQSSLFILCLAFYGVSKANAKEKLIIEPGLTKVRSSLDLRTTDTFDFGDFKTYHMTISVTDDTMSPAEGAILRVYQYDQINGQKQGLLFAGRTDISGFVYRTLELSNLVDSIQIQVNVLGKENHTIFTLAEEENLFIKL